MKVGSRGNGKLQLFVLQTEKGRLFFVKFLSANMPIDVTEFDEFHVEVIL